MRVDIMCWKSATSQHAGKNLVLRRSEKEREKKAVEDWWLLKGDFGIRSTGSACNSNSGTVIDYNSFCSPFFATTRRCGILKFTNRAGTFSLYKKKYADAVNCSWIAPCHSPFSKC